MKTITPTKTFFSKTSFYTPHSPNLHDRFLQKKLFQCFLYFPSGFVATLATFLKAALEDSHPVVRQNAAGALARKLNSSSKVCCFGRFAGDEELKNITKRSLFDEMLTIISIKQVMSQTSRRQGRNHAEKTFKIKSRTPAPCHPFCSFQPPPSACLKTRQQGCQSHE